MRDGEKVYQYLKSSLVTGKIGIHGESLGGCIASYVAKKNKLDFVFSDRTFSALLDVAEHRFGGMIIRLIFRLITGWSEECDINFKDI